MRKSAAYVLFVSMALLQAGVRGATASDAKRADAPVVCPATFNDSLETNGVLGGDLKEQGVVPPKVIHSVEAEFSKEARKTGRKKKLTEYSPSIINFIVDKNGNPTELCLKQAAGYGLDAEAGKALRQYLFNPATKEGVPVAVRINIEVRFPLY